MIPSSGPIRDVIMLVIGFAMCFCQVYLFESPIFRAFIRALWARVKIAPRPGPWKTAYFCVNCEKRLANHQLMHNEGTCPYCGYKGPGAATITETFTRPIRKWTNGRIETGPVGGTRQDRNEAAGIEIKAPTKEPSKPGPWETAYFCVNCETRLGNQQRMHSKGTCPWCGHKAPGADTITATFTRPVRVWPDGREEFGPKEGESDEKESSGDTPEVEPGASS